MGQSPTAPPAAVLNDFGAPFAGISANHFWQFSERFFAVTPRPRPTRVRAKIANSRGLFGSNGVTTFNRSFASEKKSRSDFAPWLHRTITARSRSKFCDA